MIEALVFDLDDTLYPESHFVASGYKAVANYLAARYGLGSGEVFDTMIATFTTHGRHMVLPTVLEKFLASSIPLTELVDVYRQHNPVIRLFPGYENLLGSFHRKYRLGIITDGLPEVQQRKIRALQLEALMDKIIYTWEYGIEKAKPDPLAFSKMLDCLGAEPSRTLFVGDNPRKDCCGAHAAGMKYAQIGAPSGRPSSSECGEEPEFYIDSLHGLSPILSSVQD